MHTEQAHGAGWLILGQKVMCSLSLSLKQKKKMARGKPYTRYKFEFESFLTGHYVYKDIWTPVIGEKSQGYMEDDNPHDRYAIKLVKNNATVMYQGIYVRVVGTYYIQVGK